MPKTDNIALKYLTDIKYKKQLHFKDCNKIYNASLSH